jgi:hypothetical protein
MTRLDIQNDDRANNPGRREADQQPGIMKVLSFTLGAMTIVSLIFTAGYNWRSVAILESNQDQFVRKDVQSQQADRVNDKLYEISRQLEELRGEIKAARRKE